MGSDFIREEKKKKPFNKAKFFRKLLINAACAVVFGIIASLVILLLTPFLQRLIGSNTSTETAGIITLPENSSEMSPEEMLSDYMLQEAALIDSDNSEKNYESIEMPLSEEQIQAILADVTLDITSYRQLSISMAALARELGKYMVTVTSSSSSIDWMNSVNNNKNITSGIIIAKNNVDLFVLVDGSKIKINDELIVTINNRMSFSGKLKAVDSNTGIAVVTVSMSNIPASFSIDEYICNLGSSNGLFVGLPVMAIGSPKGVAGSMDYGIIDVPKQTIPQIDSYVSAIQTNILGSSIASGVLFNLQGQVIGIITNKIESSSGEEVIIAYGITELKNRIEKMSNGIDINYLGIRTMDVTNEAMNELGIPQGAYVVSIQMDSPAMRAGIQTGDVIISVDSNTITTNSEYVNTLNQKNVGDTIKLNVMRKSQDMYAMLEFDLVVEGVND